MDMTILAQRFPEFDPNHFKGGYWNANGYAVAVVATVTPRVDWAAYIGGADPQSEKEALRYTAMYGSKLSEIDARHFFPDIDLTYRR